MNTIFFYSSYFGGGYDFSLNLLASFLLSMEIHFYYQWKVYVFQRCIGIQAKSIQIQTLNDPFDDNIAG